MARRKVDPLSIRIIIEIVVLSAVLIGLLIGIGAVWAGVETDGGDPTPALQAIYQEVTVCTKPVDD